jgi:hypothetical protein
LNELSKKPIDVSGKLKFNRDGEATLKLKGMIIDCPTNQGTYTIVLTATIKAEKITNHFSRRIYKGFNPGFVFQVFNDNNERVYLSDSQHENILETLTSITTV